MKRYVYIKSIMLTILTFYVFAEDKASVNFEKGKIFYSHKKFAIAKDLFKKALEEDSFNDEVYFYLGNIYNLEKNFTEAAKNYQRAIELNSKNHIYYNNYADMYYRQKLYDVALEMYKKGIELNSGNYHAVFHMGFAYFRLSKYIETADTFELFLKINPDYFDRQKVEELIKRLRAKIISGDLITGRDFDLSRGTNDSGDLPFSIDLDKIKEGGKEMESKNADSIDDIEMEVDIVE